MFTGIIETQGTVVSAVRNDRAIKLIISCTFESDDLADGHSVAVDGVCLTVSSIKRSGSVCQFSADVMPETFIHTTIPLLHHGSTVNIERAVKADGRFGGHLVTGHIDGTGSVRSIVEDQNERSYTIAVPVSLLAGIVQKGSVAVDGVSLTVTAVEQLNGKNGTFSVGLIPHTRECTGLSQKRPGAIVNIECDVIGKYVERCLSGIQRDTQKTGDSGWIEQFFLQ